MDASHEVFYVLSHVRVLTFLCSESTQPAPEAQASLLKGLFIKFMLRVFYERPVMTEVKFGCTRGSKHTLELLVPIRRRGAATKADSSPQIDGHVSPFLHVALKERS